MKFPWVSSRGSDFNRDFSAFNEKDRTNGTGFNFGTLKRAALNVIQDEELMALSAFALEDGASTTHTLVMTAEPTACTSSGNCSTELLKGRDEGASRGWPGKDDEYGTARNHEHGLNQGGPA